MPRGQGMKSLSLTFSLLERTLYAANPTVDMPRQYVPLANKSTFNCPLITSVLLPKTYLLSSYPHTLPHLPPPAGISSVEAAKKWPLSPKQRNPGELRKFDGCIMLRSPTERRFWLWQHLLQPPEVTTWRQLWQGEEGVGKAMPTHQAGPGQETSRQAGTARTWKHKKGKTDSRVQENPLSLASPEAFSADRKSWGAAPRKAWPFLSFSERGKKVRKWVALRRLLWFQSKKELFLMSAQR